MHIASDGPILATAGPGPDSQVSAVEHPVQTPLMGRSGITLTALLGFLPYVSTLKFPPSPSFWGEWAAVILACAWLAALPSRAPDSSGTATEKPRAWVGFPIATLSCTFFGMSLLYQLLVHQPLFRGGAVLTLAAMLLAGRLCIAGARLRQARAERPWLDAFSFALLGALVLNVLAIVAERQGIHVYVYMLGYRTPPDRAEGLIGQPNQLAAFGVLASLAAHYLWMRGRLPSALHVLAALMTAFVIAATGSRAGLIVWGIGAVASALALRTHDRRRTGFVLLGVAITLVVAAQLLLPLLSTGGAALAAARGESRGRLELWRDSWELIKLHPWAGVGYGNFMAARWNELSGSLLEPNANQAHNLIAQLVVELGVPWAMSILIPLAWALWRCVRVAVQRGVRPEQYLAASIALVLGAYAMVEYPLWYMFFLIPFALALGLVEQPERRIKLSLLSPLWRIAGWLVVAGGCALLAVDYHRSETLYTSLIDQMTKPGAKPVLIPMQEAASINSLTAFDTYSALMFARTLHADGLFMGFKLEANERAMSIMTNQETIGRQVALLVVAGKPVEARALLDRTRRGDDLELLTRGVLKSLAPSHPAIAQFVQGLPPVEIRPVRR